MGRLGSASLVANRSPTSAWMRFRTPHAVGTVRRSASADKADKESPSARVRLVPNRRLLNAMAEATRHSHYLFPRRLRRRSFCECHHRLRPRSDSSVSRISKPPLPGCAFSSAPSSTAGHLGSLKDTLSLAALLFGGTPSDAADLSSRWRSLDAFSRLVTYSPRDQLPELQLRGAQCSGSWAMRSMPVTAIEEG